MSSLYLAVSGTYPGGNSEPIVRRESFYDPSFWQHSQADEHCGDHSKDQGDYKYSVMPVGGRWIRRLRHGENEEDSDRNIRMKPLTDCLEVTAGIEAFYPM